MSARFPTEGVEVTVLLVVADVDEIRALFRDPDGHLLEISEVR